MRTDGTYLFELDTGDGDAFDPSWSPDGKYLAFVSNRDGDYDIYRINAPALEP
jgi:Tol biopolymer transport system component